LGDVEPGEIRRDVGIYRCGINLGLGLLWKSREATGGVLVSTCLTLQNLRGIPVALYSGGRYPHGWIPLILRFLFAARLGVDLYRGIYSAFTRSWYRYQGIITHRDISTTPLTPHQTNQLPGVD